MSEENNRSPAQRKKRVQTLKKLIILMLVISIIIPWVCCAILFVKVHGIHKTQLNLENKLQEMQDLLLEQQSLLQRLTEEASVIGEGVPDVNESCYENSNGESAMGQGSDSYEVAGVVEKEGVHKVYLTFDDGPSIYTEDILDILNQYDVKATFFVVGKEDDSSKEMLREIVAEGHTLGMHSYSHKYHEIYKSVDNFAADFDMLRNYLYDVTGVESTIYRFPGGSSNTVSNKDMQLFADYLEEQGIVFYDWNISSGDGGSALLSVQEIVDNCTKEIENFGTSIILLHDSGDKRTTVEALPVIIEKISEMEDTVILPITEETEPIQHISKVYTKVK